MVKLELVANKGLVGYCGLYCGACASYLKGRCKGCHEKARAGWCKVRTCCIERSYATCADCTTHADPNNCGYFNNFISKLMGLVLNSNRRACIAKIREVGVEEYAAFMTGQRRQTLPRRS